MQVDIDDVRNGKKDDEIVYICSVMLINSDKKRIEKILPTKVLIVSNKEIEDNYNYSLSHFIELNENGIRKFNIIRLNSKISIFTEKQECINFFNKKCDKILKKLEEDKEDLEFAKKEIEKRTNLILEEMKIIKDLKIQE